MINSIILNMTKTSTDNGVAYHHHVKRSNICQALMDPRGEPSPPYESLYSSTAQVPLLPLWLVYYFILHHITMINSLVNKYGSQGSSRTQDRQKIEAWKIIRKRSWKSLGPLLLPTLEELYTFATNAPLPHVRDVLPPKPRLELEYLLGLGPCTPLLIFYFLKYP
jgi:hypothetical protein